MESNQEQQSQKQQQEQDYKVKKLEFQLKVAQEKEIELDQVLVLDNGKVFVSYDKEGLIHILDSKNDGQILNSENETKIKQSNNTNIGSQQKQDLGEKKQNSDSDDDGDDQDEEEDESNNFIKYPFVYDSDRVCFINGQEQCLNWFNTQTFEKEVLFEVQIPTLAALEKADRNQENINSILSFGTFVRYLKESKAIVVMENLSSYQENNETIIITTFQLQEDKSVKTHSVSIQQNSEENINIEPLNNTDLLAIYQTGQDLDDEPIEFMYMKIEQNPIKVQLKDRFQGTIEGIIPWGENCVQILTNDKMTGYPMMKTVQLSEKMENNQILEEKSISLNIFSEQENIVWGLTDIITSNFEQKKIIWIRNSISGNYLDLFNPDKMTTASLDIDMGSRVIQEDEIFLDSVASPDGNIIITYNSDTESIKTKKKCFIYPFIVNKFQV